MARYENEDRFRPRKRTSGHERLKSLKPGSHAPGYGYQVWLLATKHRMFALRDLRGQFVFVDPESKVVLVQTAIQDGSYNELFALWSALTAHLQ